MHAPRTHLILILAIGCAEAPEPIATDVAEVGGRNFLDLANVANTASACSTSSYSVGSCYNLPLPPEPSTLRSQAVHFNSYPPSTTGNVRARGTAPQSTTREQTFQLGTRSSLDGRLNIVAYGDRALLSPIYPENLTYGWQTKIGYDVRPPVSATIQPWMRVGLNTGMTLADQVHGGAFYPYTAGSDICNKGDASEPYRCTARLDANDAMRTGICYDIAIVSTFPRNSELRTNDLTVFVQNMEYVPEPNDGVTRKMWIYPTPAIDALAGQIDASGRKVLPDFAGFDAAKSVHAATEATFSVGSGEKKLWRAAILMQQNHCVGPNAPDWCWFYANQKYNSTVSVPDETRDINGNVSYFRPIELSTTGDGHVIVGHDARSGGVGFFYGYGSQACDASTWTTFHPLSRAHGDGNVHGRYGFAEHPVVYPDGTPATPGDKIGGAYPWIDRAGANVFLGSHVPTFGWKECDPALLPSLDADDCGGEVGDVNAKNAKAPKVVGLWTRGKMIHLDGVINGSDWTARTSDADPFYVAAFGDGDWVKVRPGNNTDFFTFENLFNQFDATTPLLPGDVVWTMTAGSNHVNAEVSFDDYLTEGALIIAPMNDRLQMKQRWINQYGEPGGLNYWRNNGMSFNGVDDVENEKFTGNGIYLQNNAPLSGSNLPRLWLRGGAFIPPISTGVIGKAVYLDGHNDHIEVAPIQTNPDHFYLGLWVELHDFNTRTLYKFPDDSIVRVSHNSLWFQHSPTGLNQYGCFGGGQTQIVSAPIGTERWTHIGLAFGGGDVHVYVDGNLVGTKTLTGGFDFGAPYDPFIVGTNEDLCYYYPTETRPVRAWIDELKLFELSPGQKSTAYFAEIACNHALGSRNASGQCEQIDFRQTEVLDANGVGSGLEFPLATYRTTECGSSTHRNAGSDCGRMSALGIAPLDPDDPRPNESSNLFCQTCHDPSGPRSVAFDEINSYDLSMLALVYESWHDAKDDRRRQPLFYGPEFDELLWDGTNNVKMGCGVGYTEVGRFSTWWGKVNTHRDLGGPWEVDSDCTSGANLDDVTYCQKFWPTSTHLYRTERSPHLKPFATAYCGGTYPHVGQREFVCCEPE
ncbi:MAG: LamG-like jellyroll fold domain-containing protein [Deltaproteobacteria bacterium]